MGRRRRRQLTWRGQEPITQFGVVLIKGTFMERTQRDPKVLEHTVGEVSYREPVLEKRKGRSRRSRCQQGKVTCAVGPVLSLLSPLSTDVVI